MSNSQPSLSWKAQVGTKARIQLRSTYHFQELIEVLEYNDNKTIVIKFHKGLDPSTQNKVVLLGDLAPDFDNSRGWYRHPGRSCQELIL